ncbi:MAG: two pore domain potassium channel family protein [Flavobacteriaceae bacterium]
MKKQNNYVIANKVKQSLKIKLQLNRLLRHSFLIPRNDKLKKLLFLFVILFSLTAFCQEDDINWRVIPSLTEWIKEINNSPDSVYVAEDIKILIDMEKDSLIAYRNVDREKHEGKPRKIVHTINKPVRLNRWFIETGFGTNQITVIQNIRFTKEVYLREMKMYGFAFKKMIFEEELTFNGHSRRSWFRFNDCEFRKDLSMMNINEFSWIFIEDSVLDEMFYTFQVASSPIIGFKNTTVKENLFLAFTKLKQFNIDSCKVETLYLENTEVSTAAYLTNSKVINIDLEGALLPESNTYMPFNQISHKVGIYGRKMVNDSIQTTYYKARTSEDFKDKQSYDLLIASYKLLLKSYQNRGDMESYNACYVEMRDKETSYFKYVLDKEPSFDNFLTYQLNVFLRAFSDYGTKPTKAIVVSVYVIFFFALIYLFFPNSWDKHGRKRIVDRYTFFLKYMDKDAGMHEVYLEDQKEELLEFADFKMIIDSKEKKVPKIFTATALPLYKWAISGTKLSASVLKRIDVMKGTWQEVPKSKRIWKYILLVSAFLIALMYDVFIKVLNALMLSINTFTTLGFGEIPIKGLPRYLAIIQGFIGWFMLTIFSVSLISQLLN